MTPRNVNVSSEAPFEAKAPACEGHTKDRFSALDSLYCLEMTRYFFKVVEPISEAVEEYQARE